MVFTGNYRNMNDYLTMVSSSFKSGIDIRRYFSDNDKFSWEKDNRRKLVDGKISVRIKRSFEKTGIWWRNWRLEAVYEPLESSEHRGWGTSPTHSITVDLRKGRCEIAVAVGFRRRTEEKDKKRNKIGGPKVKNVNICLSFVFSFGPIWAHKQESVQQV